MGSDSRRHWLENPSELGLFSSDSLRFDSLCAQEKWCSKIMFGLMIQV